MCRLYRRMSSSLGLHVPPNVLLLLKVTICTCSFAHLIIKTIPDVCRNFGRPLGFTAELCIIALYSQAPLYLADDCCLVSDSTRRSLRSADVPTCVVPRTLSSYGDRTFCSRWTSLVELSSGPGWLLCAHQSRVS